MDYEEAASLYGNTKLPVELIDQLPLIQGGGSRKHSVCVMQMAAWVAGEQHTDRPACCSPTIGEMAIYMNDKMTYDNRQGLRPLIMTVIVGSANAQLEQPRRDELFKVAVQNLNEVFTKVTSEDRVFLAPFVERLNAAVLNKQYSDALHYDDEDLDDIFGYSFDDASLPRKMTKMILGSYGEIGHLMRAVSSADEFFGTGWTDDADADKTKPQPGARGIAAIKAVLAVGEPGTQVVSGS